MCFNNKKQIVFNSRKIFKIFCINFGRYIICKRLNQFTGSFINKNKNFKNEKQDFKNKKQNFKNKNRISKIKSKISKTKKTGFQGIVT